MPPVVGRTVILLTLCLGRTPLLLLLLRAANVCAKCPHVLKSAQNAHTCPHTTRARRLKPGDCVLLVFLPSLDFIVAFLACIRSGIIAVPVYPPDPRRTKAHFGAFASIAAGCKARVALTHAAYRQLVSLAALKDTAAKVLGSFLSKRGTTADSGGGSSSSGAPVPDWPDLNWQPVDAWMKGPPKGGPGQQSLGLDATPLSHVAFLQYTSGSTSDPKGVMITHGNLAHNLTTIVRSLRAGTDTVVVSWLPQYHDMGLIGAYLGTLFCGGSGVYMSPVTFIKHPPLWVAACAKWHATHVQCPNFGLRLTVRKWNGSPEGAAAAASLAGGGGGKQPPFNLSSVRHIFNAAEPILPAAIAEFMDCFAPYGLLRGAMSPGYGLAEHTVYVSDAGQSVITARRAEYEERGFVVLEGEAVRVDSLSSTSTSAAPLPSALGPTSTSSASRPDTLELVSCGPVAPHTPDKNGDVLVLIVNTDTRVPVPSGQTGEVWLRSPSVAAGYWNLPELSAEAFRAKLADTAAAMATGVGSSSVGGGAAGSGSIGVESALPAAAAAAAAASGNGVVSNTSDTTSEFSASHTEVPSTSATTLPPLPPSSSSSSTLASADDIAAAAALHSHYAGLDFLRTGDIGVIVAGELYICGRIKDLIILRGRNYFPQDIEATIERAGDGFIRPGCTAAFQVEAGSSSRTAAPAASSSAVDASASASVPPTSNVSGMAHAAAAASRGVETSSQQQQHESMVVVALEIRDVVSTAPSEPPFKPTPAALEALAATLRTAVMRDHGLSLGAIVFLKQRGICKVRVLCVCCVLLCSSSNGGFVRFVVCCCVVCYSDSEATEDL